MGHIRRSGVAIKKLLNIIGNTLIMDNVTKWNSSCNIPFAVAEHELFKNMITALRPGYQPPSRKVLAGNLPDT